MNRPFPVTASRVVMAVWLLAVAFSPGRPLSAAPQATDPRASGATRYPDLSQVVLNDVAAAEAEGAQYPHGDLVTQQANFASGVAASTPERRCADTTTAWAVRSGEFAVGPLDAFRESWQQGHTKVWWVPRFLADVSPRFLGADGLLVRSTRLAPSPEHATYRYGQLVRNTATFFNSDFWLPAPGRWMLVATFGPNWGCVIVELH